MISALSALEGLFMTRFRFFFGRPRSLQAFQRRHCKVHQQHRESDPVGVGAPRQPFGVVLPVGDDQPDGVDAESLQALQTVTV